MLTAQEQTLFDNAKLLCETIRKTQNHGRHDGLGNPIIAPELYEQWADEACDGVEWLLSVAKASTPCASESGECEPQAG